MDSDDQFEMVSLADIRENPRQVRKDIGDVSSLAESIRSVGLLQPVVLIPADDGCGGYFVVAGHRRVAACRLADMKAIRALTVSAEEGSAAEQVITMLVENLQRQDLSPIEEAHGYQQLLAFGEGFTPAKIGKRVGRPTQLVKARLGLTKLPESVQEQVHSAQLSLNQAEALVEFHNDPDAISALVNAAGTSNWEYVLHARRLARQRARDIADLKRELEQRGIRVIERPAGFPWDSTARPIELYLDPDTAVGEDGQPQRFTAERHQALCPHHAAFIRTHDLKPEFVCADPDAAGHVTPPPAAVPNDPDREAALRAEEERWEQEHERHRERHDALVIARDVRREFLASIARPTGKAGLLAHLRFILGQLVAQRAENGDWSLQEFAASVGLPKGEDPAGLFSAFSSIRTVEAVTAAIFTLIATDLNDRLIVEWRWNDPAHRNLMDYLTRSCGYTPSEIEADILKSDAADGGHHEPEQPAE